MRRFGFVILLCLVSGVAVFAQTIEVVPRLSDVRVGKRLLVDANVSGLKGQASPSLGAFDVSLEFSSSALKLVDVQFSPFLGDGARGQVVGIAGGERIVCDSLLAPSDLVALQPGEFPLFTAVFEVLQPGPTEVGLRRNGPLSDERGEPLELADVRTGLVAAQQATDVPTLSSWGGGLLLAALLGLGVYFLKR